MLKPYCGTVPDMEPMPSPVSIPFLRPAAMRAGTGVSEKGAQTRPRYWLAPGDFVAGGLDNEIRRLRRNGTWASVRRGSYLPAGQLKLLDDSQRHELLVRSTIPGLRNPAVVSHMSAAVLHGIPLWSTHLGLVHVTRPQPANGGRSGSLLCHTAALPDNDIAVVDDIRITTPARTIADLARLLPFEQAVVAADGALHKKLMTAAQLVGAAEAIRGAPGSRSAIRVARFASGLSESVGESRSRVMMYVAALPPPILQLDVHDIHGRMLGRSDYSWHGGRLLGEFDGKIKYGRLLKPGESPGDAVFREKRREDALRDNGSRMVRWVWAELAQPHLVVERIRRAYAAVQREIERGM